MSGWWVRMRRSPEGLARDRCGTSTVELALIMPILALLILLAADFAMAFKTKILLQRAAERTAQLATSGGMDSSAYDNLAADAAEAAGVPAANVSITSTLLCNDMTQASTDTACAPGQQIKRYVLISIAGSYAPMFGTFMPGTRWGTLQAVPLSGSASVRLQ